MRKVVFVIDGWFMRKRITKLNAFDYNGKEIREYCLKHINMKYDELYRIFYYDSEPLIVKGKNPISGTTIDFSKTDVAKEQYILFQSLKHTPNFALRLGTTHWFWNDWQLKTNVLNNLIKKTINVDDLKDYDFVPVIKQKGVDMRLGIDVAQIALKRLADTLIIITADADFVPLLKFVRREGMIVGIDPLYNNIKPELEEHVDFITTRLSKMKKKQKQKKKFIKKT